MYYKISNKLIKTHIGLLLGVSLFQVQLLCFYTCAPQADDFLPSSWENIYDKIELDIKSGTPVSSLTLSLVLLLIFLGGRCTTVMIQYKYSLVFLGSVDTLLLTLPSLNLDPLRFAFLDLFQIFT